MSKSDIALKLLADTMKNVFQGAVETSYATITAVTQDSVSQQVVSATGTINNMENLPIRTMGWQPAVGDSYQVIRPRDEPSGTWQLTGERQPIRPSSGIVNSAASIPVPAVTGITTAAFNPTIGGQQSNINVAITPVGDQYEVTAYVVAYCTSAEYTLHSGDVTWIWPSKTIPVVTGQTSLQALVPALLPGTTYYVKVQTVNRNGTSAWSTPTTITTAAATPTPSSGANISLRSWSSNATFAISSAAQVQWYGPGGVSSTHTITFSDGTAYTIDAGNTGNMSALTYIYLDIAVSTTAYQTTTTWSNAVGDGRVIVAIAQNGANKATVVPQNGAMPAIAAEHIIVTSLDALTATMGNLTINGTLKTGVSPNPRIEITSTLIAGYSDATTKQFYIQASDGKGYFGAGNIYLDSNGLNVIAGGSGGSYQGLRFIQSDGTLIASIGYQYYTVPLSVSTMSITGDPSGIIEINASSVRMIGGSGIVLRSNNLTSSIDSSGNLKLYGALYLSNQTTSYLAGVTAGISINTATAYVPLTIWDAGSGAFQILWTGATASNIGGFTIAQSSGDIYLNLRENHDMHLSTNNTARVNISNTGAIQFATYGAGTLTTDGSGNITATSDERLKNILYPFTRGLECIDPINPIFYKWNKDSGLETGRNYVGFGANNVEITIPEAVGINQDGYKTLQDRVLIATLWNSVRQLKNELRALELKSH